MCFFSRSGYRPFINPPPSLGNLLLDITLCSISFRCRFVLFFFVNFRVRNRVRVSYRVSDGQVGLPTLYLGIPGRPPLPFRPFPPSPPSFFYPPLPPSRSPWAPPLNQLGVWGRDVSYPSGSGAKPQPTNDLVHIGLSEPKGAALVATVFVHFHNNKFKFLYKHKTAQQSLQCESESEGEALSGVQG